MMPAATEKGEPVVPSWILTCGKGMRDGSEDADAVMA
jgi:hypothetical protein